MRPRLGIYFVVVAFVLTWPLHLGAASFVLTELVGELFAPHKDHLLLWFLFGAIGGALMILLIVGVLMRKRLALYLAALVLFGGIWTLSTFPLKSAYDWVFEIALAALLLLSGFYLCWAARHTRRISNEHRVA